MWPHKTITKCLFKKNTKIQFNNILNFNIIYYFRVKIIFQMIENKNIGKNRNGKNCFV